MENSELKIVFAGTPEFGRIILEKLCQAKMKPLLVITAPDKPAGRKLIITPPPVKVAAQNYGIAAIQPEKIKDCKKQIADLKPDILISASYGQILPQDILDIPKHGCLNVHPSLLPKYRGPSPIQYAILNGEKETGVSLILMDGKIDHGPILAQKDTALGPNETAKQLYDRLAFLAADLLIDAIPDWIAGDIKPYPQDEKRAAYTEILTKKDGQIDWKKPAELIERQIRAFNPWPGSYVFWKKNKREIQLKILQARLEKGKLIIETVRPEGKKPMSFQDFLRGNPDFKLT